MEAEIVLLKGKVAIFGPDFRAAILGEIDHRDPQAWVVVGTGYRHPSLGLAIEAWRRQERMRRRRAT